jgi:hypothetical protein
MLLLRKSGDSIYLADFPHRLTMGLLDMGLRRLNQVG